MTSNSQRVAKHPILQFLTSIYSSSRLYAVHVHARISATQQIHRISDSVAKRNKPRRFQQTSLSSSGKWVRKREFLPLHCSLDRRRRSFVPRRTWRRENIWNSILRGPQYCVSIVSRPRHEYTDFSQGVPFFSFYERHASHFCIITAVVIPLPRRAAGFPPRLLLFRHGAASGGPLPLIPDTLHSSFPPVVLRNLSTLPVQCG